LAHSEHDFVGGPADSDFWTLRRLSSAQSEVLGGLHEPVGAGGGDGRVEEDVATVRETAVLVVLFVDRFWL
jgi:hypothetical protein